MFITVILPCLARFYAPLLLAVLAFLSVVFFGKTHKSEPWCLHSEMSSTAWKIRSFFCFSFLSLACIADTSRHTDYKSTETTRRIVRKLLERKETLDKLERFFGGNLDEEMLDRSLVFTGDPTRVQRVLQRSNQNHEVPVIFLGGPEQPFQPPDEPFYDIFMTWINEQIGNEHTNRSLFKPWKFSVAKGGSIGADRVIESVLTHLRPDDAAILVVDLALEDCILKPNQNGATNKTLSAVQRLVRYALNYWPGLAIIFVEVSMPSGCGGDLLHSQVTNYYNVPRVSWTAAVGAAVAAPPGRPEVGDPDLVAVPHDS